MKMSRIAVNQIQKRLPKVIDARTHGFIDYARSALFLAAGVVLWHKNRRAAIAALGTGTLVLAQSLLTNYPLGVSPVIDFDTHGKIDASLASASFIVPRAFGFSGTNAERLFQASAVVETCIVGLTDWDSQRARDVSASTEDYWAYTADSHTSRVA